jgi:glycogen(starch) synthase
MKILLIGPYPPPHGGVSVHVRGAYRQLIEAGVPCRVLNTDRLRPGLGFGIVLLRRAWRGWTVHLHTNGHNWKSWVLALGCGLAGRSGGGCILTLHSGMVPGYLEATPRWRRRLAALACRLYTRVICVSPAIRTALVALGLPPEQTAVVPAFLKTERPDLTLGAPLLAWAGQHRPLLSTALFFRPEYGFDLLVDALVRLRERYPSLGCMVMGSGEQRAAAETRIRQAGLQDNILIAGDIDHQSCLAVMSLSDVFVRPTLEDGDSISVREALSLGVPVVASRVGTRPAGALLFPAGDVNGLVAQVEQALAVDRGAAAPAAGGMDRLMEIYQQVAA